MSALTPSLTPDLFISVCNSLLKRVTNPKQVETLRFERDYYRRIKESQRSLGDQASMLLAERAQNVGSVGEFVQSFNTLLARKDLSANERLVLTIISTVYSVIEPDAPTMTEANRLKDAIEPYRERIRERFSGLGILPDEASAFAETAPKGQAGGNN